MDNTDIMISVILITYNHEEYIKQALESIITTAISVASQLMQDKVRV